MGTAVLDGLIAIAAEEAHVDPATITADARLRDRLGLDSLALIDLVVAAEDRFGVRIPDDDAERFVTLGDVAAFIQAALPRQ